MAMSWTLSRYWSRFLLVLITVIAIDFATKRAVAVYMPLKQGAYISPLMLFHDLFTGIDCEITHTCNTGAAWGMFSTFPQVLVFFRLIFICVLIIYILFSAQKSSIVPLSLIAAGAIGNVVDYFLYGHVIDMIHFRFWGWSYPVFNVADAAICSGTFWLFLQLLFQRSKT